MIVYAPYVSICVILKQFLPPRLSASPVSGDPAWLQALGFTLDYRGAANDFKHAEMRAIGIRFG